MDAKLAQRIQYGLTLQERDPLAFWSHANDMFRRATLSIGEGLEVYVRVGNGGGKTEWGSAVVTALMQGRPELDGIPLPILPTHSVAAVLVLDHQQQVLSVQPAYLKHLGDWPHEIGWKSRANNIIGTIKVRRIGSGINTRGMWSTIHFISQENPNATIGARFHVAHADEPPKEHIWNEVRARAIPGQPFIRLITATPLIRRQWYWLKEQFPEEFTGQPYKGRIELRASIYDNAFMPESHREKLVESWRDDPLFKARVYGEYVDASGKCPFDIPVLQDLLRHADRFRRKEWEIEREIDTDSGRTTTKETIEYEILHDKKAEEAYYLNLDASAGIADKLHDPCAGELWTRGTLGIPTLTGYYNGYCGAYGLGFFGAGLAKDYNNALVDPETGSSGWGAPVLSALANCGYGHIAQRGRKEVKPGVWEPELGFATSSETRPGYIAAIQEWLRSVKSGRPIAHIGHPVVLQQMLDTVLDEKGKPVAAPGYHDEHLILAGRALKFLACRRPSDVKAKTENEPWRPRPKTLADYLGLNRNKSLPPKPLIRMRERGR